MKKLFFLFLTIVTLASQQMMAIPASPAKRMVKLQDNTMVELTLRGDEDFHFWQAADGRVFLEKKGQYIQIKTSEVDELWSQNRRIRGKAFEPSNRFSKAKAQKRADGIIGKKKGLVILVNFKDNPDATEADKKAMPWKMSMADPVAYYNDFFNKRNYTSNGFTGSVKDYFYDQSYGQFELDFDIVGPVESKYPLYYYGQNDDKRKDIRVQELIPEVCRAVDSKVNFKDYDWDGDGWVDQVFVIYAGYGEAQGAPSSTIWPHESSVAHQDLRLDGVRIGTYAVACELRGASGTTPDGIGTACHEFTHCLGIMDMYDTTYSGGFGTGNWDLMCQGSYNNSAKTPPSYTSYEKMVSGWLEPKELSTQTSVSALKYIADAPDAYILYNDGNRNEYYMLENRQAVKWDAPIGAHGMLVLHVEYDENAWGSNTINSTPTRQRMTIVPADGVLSSYNLQGDVYPGTTGNTYLSRYSLPAATVYNKNTDGSLFLNKSVVDIKEAENGDISFIACMPELSAPAVKSSVEVGAGSFTVSWTPDAAAEEYDIQLTEFAQEVKSFDESIIINETFEKCYSKSTGFTDISNKLSNYMSTTGFSGKQLYTSPNYMCFGTSKNAGYLYSPYFRVRESGKLTYAIRVQLFDGSTPVDASILHYYEGGTEENVPLTITEDGWIVDNVDKITAPMFFGFVPKSRIYMNHLMVLEGEWSKEEIIESTKKKVQHKAVAHDFTTKDSSFTFEGMNVTSTYYIKVRARNKYFTSPWSEDAVFAFSPAVAVESVSASDGISSVEMYDIYGRKADSNTKGVVIVRTRNNDGSVSVSKILRK